MATGKPLSKADLKAIHAKEFEQNVTEDKARDKNVAKQLRDLTAENAAQAAKDAQNKKT
jgi:hypothetical protein